MTHLRIFISSPGAVGREREIADRVLTRLRAEFNGRAWLPDLAEAVGGLALSDSGALDKSPLTIADNHAHDNEAAPKKSLVFDLFNLK